MWLVQAWDRAADQESARLFLVTRGAQSVLDRPEPVAIAQAPVIGLGRVIAGEYPRLRCKLVDLDPAADGGGIDSLFAEIQSVDDEDEVAYRGLKRFVHRFSPAPGLPSEGVRGRAESGASVSPGGATARDARRACAPELAAARPGPGRGRDRGRRRRSQLQRCDEGAGDVSRHVCRSGAAGRRMHGPDRSPWPGRHRVPRWRRGRGRRRLRPRQSCGDAGRAGRGQAATRSASSRPPRCRLRFSRPRTPWNTWPGLARASVC